MRYRKLGFPIPTSFYEDQKSYVDDNQFDFPPETGGEFGQDILLASPGGLASTAHHWTGGFYGKGGSSTDKFIGKKSNPYLSGEYGNLYTEKQNEKLNDTYELLPFTKIDEKELGHFKPSSNLTPVKTVSLRWAITFTFIILAIYLVLTLWGSTGMLFLKQYTNSGKDFGLRKLFLYSLIGTIFLVLFCWLLGVSFLSIFQQTAV